MNTSSSRGTKLAIVGVVIIAPLIAYNLLNSQSSDFFKGGLTGVVIGGAVVALLYAVKRLRGGEQPA
ncbi:MAG: hypothetical protein JWO25_3256 [Alphaproteobacteria bacterium]|nr:hypothetical protein [Alphaproteobacteria bacterium]MDB5719837.1 hypothetical protein [Alphaproteobacteria bacterium]